MLHSLRPDQNSPWFEMEVDRALWLGTSDYVQITDRLFQRVQSKTFDPLTDVLTITLQAPVVKDLFPTKTELLDDGWMLSP